MELTIKEMQRYQIEMIKELTAICEKHNVPYFLHAGNVIGAIRHGGPIPWDYDTDFLIPEPHIDRLSRLLHQELSPKFCVDYFLLTGNMQRIFPRIALSGYSSDVLHVDLFRLIGLPEDLAARKRIVIRFKIIRRVMILKHIEINEISSMARRIFYKLAKLMLQPITCEFLISRYNNLCSLEHYENAPYVGYLAGKHGVNNHFPKNTFENHTMIDYAGIPLKIVMNYDFYLRQLYGDYMQLPPQSEQECAMIKTYKVKEKRNG